MTRVSNPASPVSPESLSAPGSFLCGFVGTSRSRIFNHLRTAQFVNAVASAAYKLPWGYTPHLHNDFFKTILFQYQTSGFQKVPRTFTPESHENNDNPLAFSGKRTFLQIPEWAPA